MRQRSATRRISGSKVGIIVSMASINVTSDPSAVYTSENSRPMYPDPMMATQSGTHSSFRESSEVKTVLPSMVMPGGTKGIEPGARMMSLAVTVLSVPTLLTVLGPTSSPASSMVSTPRAPREFPRFLATFEESCSACAATASRSYLTSPATSIPKPLRCSASCISLTRPAAASSAFDGTQPRFTHVPPTSPPVKMAVLRPWERACRAAPCPPTPQPTMITS
mmetsp:Transcript_33266/g.77841  ORF Transcript_33266/g.77841 Transcript_33266/m.77841 type:complete len:222 (-) Transcript_33266:323-988(-)